MQTKYKFVETDGCVAFDFSVNDKHVRDMTEEEYNEMLDWLNIATEDINELWNHIDPELKIKKVKSAFLN